MTKESRVTPQLVAMTNADSSKAKVETVADKIAALQLLIDKAFETSDYAMLARLSNQMTQLKAEERRVVVKELEDKLIPELQEVLDVYAKELTPYTEFRLFLKVTDNELQLKGVLFDTVAPVPKSKTASTPKPDSNSETVDWSVHGVVHTLKATKAGQPTTSALLELVGNETHEGKTWKELFAGTKGQSNADYQMRLKLLRSIKE